MFQEGCLSVPGIHADVTRALSIVVRFLDRHGDEQQLTAEGLLAVCIQHEMDHLDGKLFIDYLSLSSVTWCVGSLRSSVGAPPDARGRMRFVLESGAGLAWESTSSTGPNIPHQDHHYL